MYRYGSYVPRGLERFVLRISQGLREGDNAILRIPAPNLNEEFLDTVKKVFKNHAGPQLVFLRADRSPDCKSLQSFLNDQLTQDGWERKKRNIQAHFGAEHSLPQAIALVGLESWAETAKASVQRELAEITAFTKDRGRGPAKVGERRFLAIVNPLFPLPPESEGLSVFNWWGATTPTDHEILFEELMAKRRDPHPTDMHWWLKALSLSVGGDDPWLIGAIVDEAPRTLGEVKALLLAHPLARNLRPTGPLPRHLLFRNLSPDPGPAPDNPLERTLWAQGLLAPNRYSLYHPVMLAMDMGDTFLEKTIAIGQREVFFTLTDQVHAFIYSVVEDRLGSMGNAFEDGPDKGEKLEKAQTELSSLFYTLIHYVRNTPKNFPECQALIDLAKTWKDIRNLNAHNKILPHQDFRTALGRYSALYQALLPKAARPPAKA
jgi:hypothetical protein